MAAENKHERLRLIGAICFVLYLLLLFYFLFFAEGFGRTDGADKFSCNLVLLKEIRRYLSNARTMGFQIVLLNLGGNILAFVPFGFFLPMLNKKYMNPMLVTLFGLAFSTAVETVQLCFKIGSFDVDDILLNTIGSFVGAILYFMIWGRKKRALSKKSL